MVVVSHQYKHFTILNEVIIVHLVAADAKNVKKS